MDMRPGVKYLPQRALLRWHVLLLTTLNPTPLSLIAQIFGIVFSLLLLRRNTLVQIFSLRNLKIFWLLDHRYGTQTLYSHSVLWMLMFHWSERWDSKSIPRQSRGLKPPRISWRLVGVSQKYSSALMHSCSVVLRPSRRLLLCSPCVNHRLIAGTDREHPANGSRSSLLSLQAALPKAACVTQTK